MSNGPFGFASYRGGTNDSNEQKLSKMLPQLDEEGIINVGHMLSNGQGQRQVQKYCQMNMLHECHVTSLLQVICGVESDVETHFGI